MFLNPMGCNYYYEITQCEGSPEEDNYSTYVQRSETRKAIHVGSNRFGYQNVYGSMVNDFMRPERENVEFLLDRYKVYFYS